MYWIAFGASVESIGRYCESMGDACKESATAEPSSETEIGHQFHAPPHATRSGLVVALALLLYPRPEPAPKDEACEGNNLNGPPGVASALVGFRVDAAAVSRGEWHPCRQRTWSFVDDRSS